VFFSFSFRHKPVALVGYSLGVAAGVRAVEHLNQIMLETEALPIRVQTLIPFVAAAFDAEGKMLTPAIDVGATVMLEELAWLGKAMKNARTEGELAPASLRIRAATGRK